VLNVVTELALPKAVVGEVPKSMKAIIGAAEHEMVPLKRAVNVL